MKTIDEFIAAHALGLDARRIRARVDIPADTWDGAASHWLVVIYSASDAMVTHYSMGSAHKGAPKLGDVLDSLAMDAYGGGETFDSFCSEFGYDADSRRALATYEACKRSTEALAAFLGPDAYRELVQETERL